MERKGNNIPLDEFLNWVVPDDRPRVKAFLHNIDEKGGDLSFRAVFGDGTIRVLQQIASLDEETGLVQGTIQDITLRQEQMHRLIRENRELAEVQSIAQIGRWELDLQRNELHWSPGIFEMFEIDPERFGASYEAFLSLIHPDDRDRVDSAYRESLETRQPYEIEHRLLFSDGRIKWVREKCDTTFSEDGKALRSTGIVQDITSRKISELKIRKMEAFLARTSQIAGIGGWEVGENDELFWSDMTRKIHEVPSDFEPNIERALAFYDGPESRQSIIDAIAGARNGKPFYRELPIRTFTGRRIWLEVRGEGEFEEGKCIRLFGTVQDISARKESETRQKAAHNIALDHNRAKSEFVSHLSHELRTPLNAVLGYAQLLQQNNPDRKSENHLSEILSACQHIQGLLEDVLDLSRIESRQISLRLESVSLPELIEQTIAIAAPLQKKYGVSLEYRDSGAALCARSDRLRLQQCLLNLITNGIKYNRNNGKVVVREELRSEQRVRIYVEDTGTGIPANKQELLFRPFQRLGRESSGIEGTGLGLLLTRNLIEMMDGSLDFQSQEGMGSTFWIELDRDEMSFRQPGRPASSTKPGRAIQGSILYIEDNPINMRLMEHIISSFEGLSLLKATTSKDGMRLAEETHIDLFLIDLRLPDGTGHEIVQSLRKSERFRGKPMICVSADAHHAEVEKALQAGFDGYITKPVDLAKLQSLLASHLSAATN